MGLKDYQNKRDFKKTPEPKGKKPTVGSLNFVVQKHDASHLHYDFRLEVEGVLKSWAIPKGPSLNPNDKRLAMQVEDHPYDYKDFEGAIPEGNYGAGTVMVWDNGTYSAVGATSRRENEKIMKKGLADGHLSFILYGHKLKGEFSLVRFKGAKDNQWLLIKKKDEYVSNEEVTDQDKSVLSKRSLDEIAHQSDSPKIKKKVKAQIPYSTNELNTIKKSPFPHDIKPMLATLIDKPFNHADWFFEIKWDGYRAIAEIEKGKVKLYSRNLQSFNQRFPAIVEDLKDFSFSMVLDGEIVILDKEGKPSFELIQNYQKEKKGTLVYFAFDLLYLDGKNLCSLPLRERKEILQKILPPTNHVRYCDHFEEKGIPFFKEVAKKKLEGIVAKDASSTYQQGKRTHEWLKIKTHLRQEAVICGFTKPKGSREHFGSLILGAYENKELIYLGSSGGGFDRKKLAELAKLMNPLIQKKCPFTTQPKINSPVTWVKPKMVCEISFAEWTKDGIMRQPIFIDLRTDKKPQEVLREKSISLDKTMKSIEPNQPKKVATQKKTTKPSKSILKSENHEPDLTHLDKVYWPDEGYTKGDLIDYYREVTSYILPYLIDRPESLNRHPNGIKEDSFFQKNLATHPSWIKTERINTEHSRHPVIDYLVVEDQASLLYMVNLGCIEINPFNSRIQSLHYPDYMILDLDPEDISFDGVVEAALVVYKILKKLGIPSVCKTSGGRGLHIYVPMGAKYTHEEVTQFSKLIALIAHEQLPDITSLEKSPSKRQGKVYYDYLRNPFGQTAVAPYCVRPRPGAPVSTPLKWSEVKPGLDPHAFTMKTVLKRFKKVGDLFKPVLGPGIDLKSCLKKLENQ